jgi:hypothetical protein
MNLCSDVSGLVLDHTSIAGALVDLATAFDLLKVLPPQRLDKAVDALLDPGELAVDAAHGDERLGRTAPEVGGEAAGKDAEASQPTASLSQDIGGAFGRRSNGRTSQTATRASLMTVPRLSATLCFWARPEEMSSAFAARRSKKRRASTASLSPAKKEEGRYGYAEH